MKCNLKILIECFTRESVCRFRLDINTQSSYIGSCWLRQPGNIIFPVIILYMVHTAHSILIFCMAIAMTLKATCQYQTFKVYHSYWDFVIK